MLSGAKLALQDRDKQLAEAYDCIETDLILLGATAVEDRWRRLRRFGARFCKRLAVSSFFFVNRLQERAADTIESLHKAGMKVWVLTGDKMETAAATCYASRLFHRRTQILELTTKRTEEQSLHDVLFDLSRTVLRHYGGMTRDASSRFVRSDASLFKSNAARLTRLVWFSLSEDCTDFGLIIDGATLSAVLRPSQEGSNSGNYKELFLDICRNCSAVLCCRMAPLQKAQVHR